MQSRTLPAPFFALHKSGTSFGYGSAVILNYSTILGYCERRGPSGINLKNRRLGAHDKDMYDTSGIVYGIDSDENIPERNPAAAATAPKNLRIKHKSKGQ